MGKSDHTFRYKVRNWPEYNRALVKRGQLTLWFDTEAVAAWRHPGPFEGRGRPKVYADAAIQCALVLNSVFHLNLRTTQGFLQSIVALMALDLPVPNYSTVSRRQSAVDVRLSVGPTDRPRHVVIDSTGLNIYGAGEWHIRKHRTLRRRTWRKLHLGVDETTKEIVAMDLTASNVHDARRLSSLLSKTPGSIRASLRRPGLRHGFLLRGRAPARRYRDDLAATQCTMQPRLSSASVACDA